MLILAFDTTGPDGSAVLFRGPERLAEVRSAGKTNYSVALFEMVDELLGASGSGLAQVELFAAATGPGSFTGIRVGLAAAQGWAKAFERPVQGVSVLDAMVEAAQPRANLAVPLMDARRGEFYLGVFRRGTGVASSHRPAPADLKVAARLSCPLPASDKESRLALLGEGMVLKVSGIAALVEELARAGERELEFIVRENDHAAVALSSQFSDWVRWRTVSSYQAIPIARIALRSAAEGRLQRPEELEATYIRRSDAEMNWPA